MPLAAAVNADGEFNDPRHPCYQRTHLGLAWGIVQFTQRGGMLGRVLSACHRRNIRNRKTPPGLRSVWLPSYSRRRKWKRLA